MGLGDTIAATASGHGFSPRAIIRLSGPAVFQTLNAALTTAASGLGPGVHAVRLKLVLESGGVAELPAIGVFFRGPASYTGEDAAELQIPGNPALVERVLQSLLAREGVRLAQPGEYSARAFLKGKLTLEQAEGVQASIAARTRDELGAAQRLLSGELGHAYRSLADEVASVLALVEAGIDFTDQEDVVPIAPEKLLHKLRNFVFGIECALGPASEASETDEPRVALVGPPNAGKSTLFNALLGRERAVVSPSAGTTRDAIEEPLVLDSSPALLVRLIDLAGLDESLASRGALDRAGQAAARLAIEQADVLLYCDPSGRFEALGVESAGVPIIRVRTKADLPLGPDDAASVAVCALDGWNLGALTRAIADACVRGGQARSAGAMVLPRHRRSLRAALEALRRALQTALASEEAPRVEGSELIAGEMRLALDALGEISGRITPDDVIGRVFSLFCVGK